MKKLSLYGMVLFYVAAGINHFINPYFYINIMPPYLPYHLELIYISGVCEIVFGMLLIPRSTRKIAAWLIIALLIAVFPANIQMAINHISRNEPDLWISIVRLPFQVLFIWWAWSFTREKVKIRW